MRFTVHHASFPGMAPRRCSALVLLFALLGGGFGLPLADVVVYHSGATSTTAHHTAEVAVGTQNATLHLQGCVLWLSALTGSGVAGSAPAVRVATAGAGVSRYLTPQQVLTQTDLGLGHSRAPPIA